MVSWAVELSEYDIGFTPRTSIKSQVLEDFMVEFSSPLVSDSPARWILSVDRSSNLKGRGASIVLEGPGDIILGVFIAIQFSNEK